MLNLIEMEKHLSVCYMNVWNNGFRNYKLLRNLQAYHSFNRLNEKLVFAFIVANEDIENYFHRLLDDYDELTL